MLYKSKLRTPIGTLGLLADKEKLLKLSFKGLKDITEEAKEDKSRFKSIFKQLEEYFAGDRRSQGPGNSFSCSRPREFRIGSRGTRICRPIS